MSLVRAAETYLAFENSPLLNGGFFWREENSRAFALKQAKRAVSRETANRLVKAAKSPTVEDKVDLEIAKAKFFAKKHTEFLLSYETASTSTGEIIISTKNKPYEVEAVRQETAQGAIGCQTVIEYRQWSDEYRIRTQTDGANPKLPDNNGKRESENLTMRGAKKIAESCEFMHMKKGGYKTFLTLTFNADARERISKGEKTIQSEVSRAMDGINKIYMRGWTTESGQRVDGHEETLPYCWVVEIPKNEEGQDNPHIHMLLGWRVKFEHFQEWAKRVEKLWGNGFAHLEKIDDSEKAGAYMAKAAGYLTKAQGSESQGLVKGNRYGISSTARAPSWVVISRSQLSVMSQLIADTYDHLTNQFGSLYQQRKKLRDELEKIPKGAAKRHEIGKALEKVRGQIKSIPIRCNKYQVILKGMTTASMFLSWAKGDKEGLPCKRPEWMPEELPKGATWVEGERFKASQSLHINKLKGFFSRINLMIHERKKIRLAKLNTNEFLASMAEKMEHFKNEALQGWFEYSSSDLCQ